MISPKQRRALLEPFVRQELGCVCPAHVFADIRIRPTPIGWPQGWLVGCGGRLLLMVPAEGAALPETDQLERLFRDAAGLRDSGGFNRFRLVLPLPANTGAEAIPPALAADERLHLHWVDPARLAGLQAQLHEISG